MVDTTRSVYKRARVSVTRPANTTAYTANTALADSTSAATLLRFDSIIQHDYGCQIVQCTATSSANQATKPDIDLLLFTDVVTIPNDNAAFAPTDADMNNFIGRISLPVASWVASNATSGAGGNAFIDVSANIVFRPVIPTRVISLIVVPVMRNTYTPVSGEVFQFTFGIKE